jgi:hypothetical protein
VTAVKIIITVIGLVSIVFNIYTSELLKKSVNPKIIFQL